MSWELSHCCFCFPLRTGLLVFGYIKLALNYVNIVKMLCQMNDIFAGSANWDPIAYIELSLGFGISIIDFIFNMVMLAGLHKNSANLLGECNNYNKFILMTQIVVAAFYIPLETYRKISILNNNVWEFCLESLCVSVLVIAVQIYFVVVVRSMCLQLKRMKIQADLEECINEEQSSKATPQKLSKYKDEKKLEEPALSSSIMQFESLEFTTKNKLEDSGPIASTSKHGL